jgi:hypothetical protein
MPHQALMASRPAVEPALVTRAQRALCTILVAATLAACSPPVAPRPAARPLAAPPVQRQYTPLVPNLTLGSPIDGSSMRFFVPTCLFQNDPNCLQAIFAIGEITPKTPGHFAMFTHALQYTLPGGLQGKWAVILDSSGGNVAAALELGTQFRQHNWNTTVGLDYPLAGQWRTATCASACVYLFAGGPDRLVLKDNVLGVHQFTDGATLRMNVAQAQYLTASISAYLIQMGVSANLQTVAGLTPPNGLTPLTIQDAVVLGLATK